MGSIFDVTIIVREYLLVVRGQTMYIETTKELSKNKLPLLWGGHPCPPALLGIDPTKQIDRLEVHPTK
jgi:hypothetical protein